ncbi:hypothetical protein FDP41_012054 [Naegleria fowleri]|uniref:Prefoldin subunit 3 n=1 Tax=Naegleria fowleri TaxID=5763 RepID=A0A6A5BVU8_NAEFO|nr:uncharacterized protein FDP41_012054 [Naegleria fowleri]KAF0982193.1 hypothetical protein FDP41_012054 [Naegleria fowleri]CAG4711051.1 unnamed protein product [Naegleria fowleri]
MSSSSNDYILHGFPDSYQSPRKIPKADFIEDVEALVNKKGSSDVQDTISQIYRDQNQKHQQYQIFEYRLHEAREQLKVKIPDIKKTIEAVKFLKKSFEGDDETDASDKIETHFKLDETVFAEAIIPKTDRVALWLGCDIMVEYSLDEAMELLNKNVTLAEQKLSEINEDIAYLKEQKTTTEVNMSRVYNYGVKKRNESKKQQ